MTGPPAAFRWEACGRKLAYASPVLADSGLPSSQFVYLCPTCDLYHRATRPDYRARVVEGELRALVRRDRELAGDGKRRKRKRKRSR